MLRANAPEKVLRANVPESTPRTGNAGLVYRTYDVYSAKLVLYRVCGRLRIRYKPEINHMILSKINQTRVTVKKNEKFKKITKNKEI